MSQFAVQLNISAISKLILTFLNYFSVQPQRISHCITIHKISKHPLSPISSQEPYPLFLTFLNISNNSQYQIFSHFPQNSCKLFPKFSQQGILSQSPKYSTLFTFTDLVNGDQIHSKTDSINLSPFPRMQMQHIVQLNPDKCPQFAHLFPLCLSILSEH